MTTGSLNEATDVSVGEPPALELMYVRLEHGPDGWVMSSNLQRGQAKWIVCEAAKAFQEELRPR